MIPEGKKSVLRFLQKTTQSAQDVASGLLRSEIQKSPVSGPDGLASSYVLSTCAYFHRLFEDQGFLDLAGRLAKPLADLITVRGGVGTDGAIFLFDTQMALQALWRYYQAAPKEADWSFYFGAADRVRTMASDLIATSGNAVSERWNARVAPYLLKIYPYVPEPEASQILAISRTPAFEAVLNGQPVTQPIQTADVIYAMEGLLQHTETKYWQLINAGRVVAEHANPDGGVPTVLFGDRGPSHAGLTAQAMRVWSSIDPGGFESSIRAAMTFVDGLFEDKGLRVAPDISRYPVTATMQALQARTFAASGADPLLLV